MTSQGRCDVYCSLVLWLFFGPLQAQRRQIAALTAFLVLSMKLFRAREQSPFLLFGAVMVVVMAFIGLIMIAVSSWSTYCTKLIIHTGFRDDTMVTFNEDARHEMLAFMATCICASLLIMWLLIERGWGTPTCKSKLTKQQIS